MKNLCPVGYSGRIFFIFIKKTMRHQLPLPRNILFPIAVSGLFFTLFTIGIDMTHLGIPLAAGRFFEWVGLIASFITVVVLIVDVFKNNVNGKYLWTLAFLLLGCMSGLYYLMNRKKWVMGS